MTNRTIAIIAAFALLAGGLAALPIALAQDNDTDEPRRGGRGGPDHDGRREARETHREEMKEARENFTSKMRESGKAHKDCAPQRGDNNTSLNETAIRECHHRVRDELKEMRLDARTHFQEAKKRAQEKYRDALQSAREAHLASHGDDKGCEGSERCVQNKIDKLEARKARAESLYEKFEEKIAELESRRANETNGTSNGTSGSSIPGLHIVLEKITKRIERIDERLAYWYGVQSGDDDGDLTSDNTTADNSTADNSTSGEDTSTDGTDGSDGTDGGSGNETA